LAQTLGIESAQNQKLIKLSCVYTKLRVFFSCVCLHLNIRLKTVLKTISDKATIGLPDWQMVLVFLAGISVIEIKLIAVKRFFKKRWNFLGFG